MNDFDDLEIIDLDDEPEYNEENESQDTSIKSPRPKEKESSPFSFSKNKFLSNKNNDATASKLQNLNKKNNLLPTNNINKKENNEEKSKAEEAADKIKTKVGAKAIEAYTGGVVNGKTAEAVADVATKISGNLTKKYKKYIIIATCSIIAFVILFCVLLISSSDDSNLGRHTYTYVTGETTEEELLEQLEYYGYCKDKSSCRQKGVYKFYTQLKEVYDTYKKDCPATLSNNNPCEVTINTGLIIETINYYQNSKEAFDVYDTEEDDGTDLSLLNWFSTLFQKITNTRKVNTMLEDAQNLALAQTEYVKETCKIKENGREKTVVNYYYQISFNKYISYLKYGNTSTHPNYSGKPLEIENETCVGPINDTISTSYDSLNNSNNNNTNSEMPNTMGGQIVNYAIQFVGNPYVWGGESLTNGADCSGFTKKVFENFGIYLPHSSISQANYGTNIGTDLSVAQAGDLIVYNRNSNGIGHVAIYMGNNKIVHAKGKKYGIVITDDADRRSIKAIVRLWR